MLRCAHHIARRTSVEDEAETVILQAGTTRERPVVSFLRHSRESNENELANYPEPPARGAERSEHIGCDLKAAERPLGRENLIRSINIFFVRLSSKPSWPSGSARASQSVGSRSRPRHSRVFHTIL